MVNDAEAVLPLMTIGEAEMQRMAGLPGSDPLFEGGAVAVPPPSFVDDPPADGAGVVSVDGVVVDWSAGAGVVSVDASVDPLVVVPSPGVVSPVTDPLSAFAAGAG